MTSSSHNLLTLVIKELRSLWADKGLLLFILWAFSGAIYVAATATSQELNNAPIAIVDEDQSPLTKAIGNAFYPPYFTTVDYISYDQIEPVLDRGLYSFVLVIPQGFQRDLLADKQPSLQLNIDATRMSQAGIGSSYIQQIISGELLYFTNQMSTPIPSVQLIQHNKFNPNLSNLWFGSIMEMIGNITMLAIIISGAALIREREHGTLEHLLSLPVTPVEIVGAKVITSILVISLATTVCLLLIINSVLGVPLKGSISLFIIGTALHLFATSSMGIFLGIVARSMPQLGLLLILTILPLQMLSGAITPRESMPDSIQWLMMAAPNTHFVSFAQSILYRGAGWQVTWPQLLSLAIIGLVFFFAASSKFRQSIAQGTD